MFRGDHLAKSPHRNIAETCRRRKQLPVLQLIAEHGVGDVVGGKGEAGDLHQQRFIGQRSGVRQLRVDDFALLQIVAGDDEVGGLDCSHPLRFTCRNLCAIR